VKFLLVKKYLNVGHHILIWFSLFRQLELNWFFSDFSFGKCSLYDCKFGISNYLHFSWTFDCSNIFCNNLFS